MIRAFILYTAVVYSISSAVPFSEEKSEKENSAPSLSNFGSAKNQDQSIITSTISSMANDVREGTTITLEHKLLNVPMQNGTGTVFLNINLHKIMEDPYVHGIVLPAAVGIIMALLTLMLVCAIRSCVRSQARKRRKRRIRNLAEELKADQKVLLAAAADSDDDEI